jgi:hypothetical protein
VETPQGISPILDGYMPKVHDVLVIVVEVPIRYPKAITIENKRGGRVDVSYPDGKNEVIARVEHPVTGIGRFDATGETGVGSINTSHTGVLTVSTAPIASKSKKSSKIETRGGFMIQPSRHAKRADNPRQILVVGPCKAGDSFLEGAAPLFSGYFGLAFDTQSEENSFRVEVRTSKAGWIPVPSIVGKSDDALMHLPGGKGRVTDIRINFPELSSTWVQAQVNKFGYAYQQICRKDAVRNGRVVKGDGLVLALDNSYAGRAAFVRLYVDGNLRGVSNNPPYSFDIDASSLAAGSHVAEISAVDSRGATVKKIVTKFYVDASRG